MRSARQLEIRQLESELAHLDALWRASYSTALQNYCLAGATASLDRQFGDDLIRQGEEFERDGKLVVRQIAALKLRLARLRDECTWAYAWRWLFGLDGR